MLNRNQSPIINIDNFKSNGNAKNINIIKKCEVTGNVM